MDRAALISELSQHQGSDEKETSDTHHMIGLLQDQERCFYRDCMPHHFTGSALLLNRDMDRVLLNHHKSLNKWLCFGGHADGDENLFQVAWRETEEESGTTSFKQIGHSFIDADIHPIPANPNKDEGDHFHCDLR